MNRRDYLTLVGAAAGAVATTVKPGVVFSQQTRPADHGAPTTSTIEDRERRMKWWHEAKFGMFIHWGLYSTLGRHEWVMENEGIPVSEYDRLAPKFKPVPNAARAWAQLAKRADMKYMVMTTQHHEGFCNFDTKLTEDFGTPEQRIEASATRPWESCSTLNDSWGYHASDTNWKTTTTVIRNLITCARDGGNYLLNIGPKPDGPIPEESARILTAVGDWMSKNGATIRESDTCQPRRGNYLSFTRKGNTLYAHVHYWPGETVVIGNLLNKVLSARMFATGEPVKFQQDEFRIRLTGLPKKAPDLVTTFALELDGEPKQDHEGKRAVKPRAGIYKVV